MGYSDACLGRAHILFPLFSRLVRTCNKFNGCSQGAGIRRLGSPILDLVLMRTIDIPGPAADGAYPCLKWYRNVHHCEAPPSALQNFSVTCGDVFRCWERGVP